MNIIAGGGKKRAGVCHQLELIFLIHDLKLLQSKLANL